MPYIPPHQISASAGLETDRWGTYISGTYVAAMREVAGSGTPGPFEENDASFVLDAAGHVVVVPGVTGYITVQNLLDATYVASHRPFRRTPRRAHLVAGGGEAAALTASPSQHASATPRRAAPSRASP